MTVCMYRDIHTLQPYIIDFTQRGCHTLSSSSLFVRRDNDFSAVSYWEYSQFCCPALYASNFDDNCHISEETIRHSTRHSRFSDFPDLPRDSVVKLQAVTGVTVVEMYGDTQLIVQCNCEAGIVANRQTYKHRQTDRCFIIISAQ